MAQVNALPDEALLKSFTDKVLDKPEVFLTKDPASAEQAKAITKYLYDLGNEAQPAYLCFLSLVRITLRPGVSSTMIIPILMLPSCTLLNRQIIGDWITQRKRIHAGRALCGWL
jgi:hypothetical protein